MRMGIGQGISVDECSGCVCRWDRLRSLMTSSTVVLWDEWFRHFSAWYWPALTSKATEPHFRYPFVSLVNPLQISFWCYGTKRKDPVRALLVKYFWLLTIYWWAGAFPAREQVQEREYEGIIIFNIGPNRGSSALRAGLMMKSEKGV